MKFLRVGSAALLLLMVGVVPPAEAAAKSGGTCARVGAKAGIAGKHYTCVRSGAKLVWRLAKPAPSASPKPVAPGEFTIVPAAVRKAFPGGPAKISTAIHGAPPPSRVASRL